MSPFKSRTALDALRPLVGKLKIRQIRGAATKLTARFIQNYWAKSDGKRVLFIEDRVPHPFLGAGFPRSNRILSEMVRMGLPVTLYAAADVSESWASVYQGIT